MSGSGGELRASIGDGGNALADRVDPTEQRVPTEGGGWQGARMMQMIFSLSFEKAMIGATKRTWVPLRRGKSWVGSSETRQELGSHPHIRHTAGLSALRRHRKAGMPG